jgi:hypothetical protein
MKGWQDNVAVIVIVIVIRSLLTSSVRSEYASRRMVDSLSPTLSRLVEAKYRMACRTMMGTRPLLLFLAMFPPLPPPSLSPTTLVTIALAALTLFFTMVAIASPPATLVTFAIALAALFIAALIIGHALSLFVVTCCHAHVHRLPSALPSLVDCCLFTPAITTAIITVSVAVASATTITVTAAAVVTDAVVNTTAINTAAAATADTAAIAAAACCH